MAGHRCTNLGSLASTIRGRVKEDVRNRLVFFFLQLVLFVVIFPLQRIYSALYCQFVT